MPTIVFLVIRRGSPFRITGVKAPFAFLRGEPIPPLVVFESTKMGTLSQVTLRTLQLK